MVLERRDFAGAAEVNACPIVPVSCRAAQGKTEGGGRPCAALYG
jgi:hypothetical protein